MNLGYVKKFLMLMTLLGIIIPLGAMEAPDELSKNGLVARYKVTQEDREILKSILYEYRKSDQVSTKQLLSEEMTAEQKLSKWIALFHDYSDTKENGFWEEIRQQNGLWKGEKFFVDNMRQEYINLIEQEISSGYKKPEKIDNATKQLQDIIKLLRPGSVMQKIISGTISHGAALLKNSEPPSVIEEKEEGSNENVDEVIANCIKTSDTEQLQYLQSKYYHNKFVREKIDRAIETILANNEDFSEIFQSIDSCIEKGDIEKLQSLREVSLKFPKILNKIDTGIATIMSKQEEILDDAQQGGSSEQQEILNDTKPEQSYSFSIMNWIRRHKVAVTAGTILGAVGLFSIFLVIKK